MSTVRTVTYHYACAPDEIAALLQDPVYLRHRSEAAGEHNVDVQIERRHDGVHITVARDKKVEVPAIAKMVVGSASRAVERTLWKQDGDTWTADYEIEVGGVPVKTHGRSVLAPNGEGTQYTSTFEITARVPLIGARLEALAAEGFQQALLQNAERNAAALVRAAKRVGHSHVDELRGDASRTAKSN